jgi:phosphatidylserine/phosphatidylglycerophosphate/cardiolipin synthase-like enzyme
MKSILKWGIGGSLTALAVVVGAAFGPMALASVEAPYKDEPAVLFSQTGRDRAFLEAVLHSRRSIYLRTGTLALVPFTNELGQAAQRGVAVHIEMPMQAAAGSKNAKACVDFLANAGAWLEIGNRPTAAYEGAYLLVDDRVFYYSAAALEYSEQGIPHSYVRGKKG